MPLAVVSRKMLVRSCARKLERLDDRGVMQFATGKLHKAGCEMAENLKIKGFLSARL